MQTAASTYSDDGLEKCKPQPLQNQQQNFAGKLRDMDVLVKKWFGYPCLRINRPLIPLVCGTERDGTRTMQESAGLAKYGWRRKPKIFRRGSWVQPNPPKRQQKSDMVHFHRDWHPAESWYVIDIEGNVGPPRAFSALTDNGAHSHDVTYDEQSSSLITEFAEFRNAAARQMGDEPVDMENPYRKPKKQCILCKHDIVPDYKNTRLLSQFTSQFSGMPYPKHVSNLCDRKHRKLRLELMKAQKACFMPTVQKLPYYVYDPMLFDPFNPKRGF